jgi:hypothetical protein
MYADIDEARACQEALRHIFVRHVAEAPDYRALRRVLELCRCAGAALDDRYCRDKLRVVEDFAAELLSRSEHRRPQFLKEQILGALELYRSRLYSLELLRRSPAAAGLKRFQPLGT